MFFNNFDILMLKFKKKNLKIYFNIFQNKKYF